MCYWTEPQTIKTVKDMYDYAVENEEELLSTFSSAQSVLYDFWLEYVTNNDVYDRAFCTKYKNWFFYDQDGTETVADVFNRFVQAVEDFLTLNDKKYTEMYKIDLMTIDSSSILSDYKLVETKEGERTVDREYVSGERSDSSTSTSGERTDESTDQVMAYNSTDFVDATHSESVKGQQEDSAGFTKGEQTDTEGVTENTGHTITTTGTRVNPYENMIKYMEAWDSYSFYTKVFKDIASELLMVM